MIPLLTTLQDVRLICSQRITKSFTLVYKINGHPLISAYTIDSIYIILKEIEVEEPKKKRGVKPLLDGRNLTFAEVKQRQRAKDKFLHDAMQQCGYAPMKTFIHTEHLKALSKLSWESGIGQFDFADPTNLSAYLFNLISDHLKQKGIVNSELPESSFHAAAQYTAELNYQQWAKAHIESLKQGDSK